MMQKLPAKNEQPIAAHANKTPSLRRKQERSQPALFSVATCVASENEFERFHFCILANHSDDGFKLWPLGFCWHFSERLGRNVNVGLNR